MHKDISSYEDWYEKIKQQIPNIQRPTMPYTYGSGADLFRKEKIFQIGNGKSPFSFFDPEQHTVPKKVKEDLLVDLGKGAPLPKSTEYKPATLVKRDASDTPSIHLKEAGQHAGNSWDEAYKEYFCATRPLIPKLMLNRI